jgi:CheY-like chemotaxis protein
VLEREQVHLILSDVRLRSQQTGIDLAHHARERNIPTLFATGHDYPDAASVAVGCLTKPYSARQLLKAIECVDRHLQGETVKPPRGLELFVVTGDSE